MVTGAMMNAAVKKAGVNVGSIQEVLDLTSTTRTTTTIATTTTTNATTTRPWLRSAFTETLNLDDVQGVETTKKTTLKTTTKPKWSTVEIIGEDGRTEIIRFQDDYESDHEHGPPPVDEHEEASGSGDNDPQQGPQDYGDHGPTPTPTTAAPDPTTTTATTLTPTTPPKLTDVYTRAMGKLNRNGLNILAVVFIALGILLLAANFMNSPEMALLYVVLLLATCIASLVLLLSVLGECARAHDNCLMKKLDWFSAFILMVFWFVYIFVWAFFAAVANGMAREMPPY